MSLRPAPELVCVVLEQQRTMLRQLVTEASRRYNKPVDGSARRDDQRWVSQQPRAQRAHLTGLHLFAAGDSVLGSLTAADENVRALKLLLMADERMPVPAMSLVRSIFEAVLFVRWLSDAEVDSNERLVRTAAAILGMLQDNLRALRDFPDSLDRNISGATEGMQDMQKLIGDQGFTLKLKRGDQSEFVARVSRESASASTAFNVTFACDAYAPGLKYIWSAGSGATHSNTWFTANLEGSLATGAVMIGSTFLDVSDVLVEGLCAYVGMDASERHRKTHLQRQALSHRITGPGLVNGHAEYLTARRGES